MGFLNFTGYLGGAQSYYGPGRWSDGLPLNTTEYSCDLYGGKALEVLRGHDPATSLFMYLPWQNVHEPYQVGACARRHLRCSTRRGGIRVGACICIQA